MRVIHVVLLMAIFTLIACHKDAKIVLPSSKGLPSELLLVVDDKVWQSDLCDTLKNITQCAIPCIMQFEPYFRVSRISSKFYSQRYRTFHSKLFVHIDDKENKASLAVAHNVSAQPQIEVTVVAPNHDSLAAFLSANGTYIRDLLNDAQIQMRTIQLGKHFSAKVEKETSKLMGIHIHVPTSIVASKKGQRFYWAGSNLNEKDLNIVLYQYPWDGKTTFTDNDFVAKRDSAMKENIPGSKPDQWMQTTLLDGKPIISSRRHIVNGKNVYEVYGMWEMRNGALGGPFVSIVSIDTTTATATVSEGFIYSPSTEKRDLLRQLEAALHTVRK